MRANLMFLPLHGFPAQALDMSVVEGPNVHALLLRLRSICAIVGTPEAMQLSRRAVEGVLRSNRAQNMSLSPQRDLDWRGVRTLLHTGASACRSVASSLGEELRASTIGA